jgi:DNA mismatch repair protein MutL
LRTIGFRGEALASIAAVAQVELKTARKEDATGTLLQISGSQVDRQETIATNRGSIFSVKNLFFNVPARRKFLKSNETELKNIITEFERVVLVNPQIMFELRHNDAEIFNLPVSTIRQRILNVFGKRLNTQLLSLQADTSLVSLSGFIGTPDSSKKKSALQYFFVNNRFMRHPYFHKAVVQAFEPFIPTGEMPNYFIYLTVDPASIDVNIHPAKTEIKFENEQAIWLIINSAVKETLAKSNAIPSLEFDREGAVDMPVYKYKPDPQPEALKINYQSGYNPFTEKARPANPLKNWEKLYVDQPFTPEAPKISAEWTEERTTIFSFKGKYLVTGLKSGLAIINYHRAHIRILYDMYLQQINQKRGISQGLLFPEIISFTPREATILPYLLDDLAYIGFDLSDLGNNTYSINGIPAGLENTDIIETLQDMTDKVLETGCEVKEEISESLALTLAKKAAIPYGRLLSEEEAGSLIANLFASSGPNYTPDGKSILSIIGEGDLEKRFR